MLCNAAARWWGQTPHTKGTSELRNYPFAQQLKHGQKQNGYQRNGYKRHGWQHHGNQESATHSRGRRTRFWRPERPEGYALYGIFRHPVANTHPELTGSAPEPTSETTAGLTHEWYVETKYYTATLPIWVDELSNVAEWRTEFTKPEAREVVTVLGAWIYCFKKPVGEKDLDAIKETMQAISDVIERACGYAGDTVCLAVAMPQSTTPYLEKSAEEWEEACMDYGFEYIDFEAKGKNDFGEAVGAQRIREALEAGEWESGPDLDFDADGEGFEGSFAAEEAEMNMELFGMKDALHGGADEEQMTEKDVEELEVMMKKMVAIKGMLINNSEYDQTDVCRNGRRHGRGRAQAVCSQGDQRPDERSLKLLFQLILTAVIFSIPSFDIRSSPCTTAFDAVVYG
jgi:hypothetical protein